MLWWLYAFVVFITTVLHLAPGIAHQAPFPSVTQTSSFLLPETYKLKGKGTSFIVRQVPGDGGCLFHSIASWISYLTDHSHSEFDYRLRYLSTKLRMLAVDILKENCTLVLENSETVDSSSLLKLVGDHYNMTPLEYCRQMMDAKTWGGGPEIVALSNHFRCPIHIYQLGTAGLFWRRHWVVELCAKFGSPVFDHIRPPLHLLCCDGRFPNIRPGQQKDGDHFLAMFPEQQQQQQQQTRLRGSFRLHGCPNFGDDPVFFERSGPEEVLRRVGGWLKGLKGLAAALPPLFGCSHSINDKKHYYSYDNSDNINAAAAAASGVHHKYDQDPLRSSQRPVKADDDDHHENNQKKSSLRVGGRSQLAAKRKTITTTSRYGRRRSKRLANIADENYVNMLSSSSSSFSLQHATASTITASPAWWSSQCPFRQTFQLPGVEDNLQIVAASTVNVNGHDHEEAALFPHLLNR